MQWPLFESAFSCLQSPILGMDGYMQPRVAFLKLDEDCFSSDSEERLTLEMPSIDNRSLLTDGVAPAPRTSRLPDREGVCNSRHPLALVISFPPMPAQLSCCVFMTGTCTACLTPFITLHFQSAAVLLTVQAH